MINREQQSLSNDATLYYTVLNVAFSALSNTFYFDFSEQAKSYLERAMKLDNTYMEAVYAMAGILAQQQQHEKAIEL